jgi:hypothetical protein
MALPPLRNVRAKKAFHVPLLTPNRSRAFHFAVPKIAAQHQGMW